jgi:hypothetical protein
VHGLGPSGHDSQSTGHGMLAECLSQAVEELATTELLLRSRLLSVLMPING